MIKYIQTLEKMRNGRTQSILQSPNGLMLPSMQAIKSSDSHVLVPGRNIISFDIPPQKPGSYVLGALTGQIGKLSFRSHGFSQDGPVETDEFMSFEKPTRPVLKVIAKMS
jgi:hypothetical protein